MRHCLTFLTAEEHDPVMVFVVSASSISPCNRNSRRGPAERVGRPSRSSSDDRQGPEAPAAPEAFPCGLPSTI